MQAQTECGQDQLAWKKTSAFEKWSEVHSVSSMLAHEMRNPLGVMRIALYNLKRKEHDPVLDRHFEVLERKIHESEKIVENLLNFTRYKAPQLSPTLLASVLDESAYQAEEKYRETAGHLVRDYGRLQDLSLPADRDQVKMIVDQLLENAYEALEGRSGEIRLAARSENNQAVITVQDQGEGIDQDDLHQVFRPFWTKKRQRLGLGLSIARQLAELHGGNLAVESRRGQGSTFTLRLPLTEPGPGQGLNS